MQIYAINGSPRKSWNTGKILENVLQGAAESNDNVLTETINLYDYHYQGCISCFECKRLGGPSYGRCAVKDDIHQLLQNVIDADIVVFGSPIYFSDLTGMMRCFLERLLFPLFVYDREYTSLAPKSIVTAMVYTMNVTREMMDGAGYPARLKTMENMVGHCFGHPVKIQYVNDTYQFKDYARYASSLFDPQAKARSRDEQFPRDCEDARKLGAELVKEAMGK